MTKKIEHINIVDYPYRCPHCHKRLRLELDEKLYLRIGDGE